MNLKSENKISVISRIEILLTILLVVLLIGIFISTNYIESELNIQMSREPILVDNLKEEQKEISEEKSIENNNTQSPVLDKSSNGIQVKDINNDSMIKFGRYLNDELIWRVVNKDNEIMLVSEYVIDVKSYDAAESGNYRKVGGEYSNDISVQQYGDNEWEISNIREWLNSSDEKVKYSSQPPNQNATEKEHSSYENETGFLYHFAKEEMDIIKPIKHGKVLDRVYLLSVEEVSNFSEKRRKITDNAFIKHGKYDEYIKKGEYLDYWLRTAKDKSKTFVNIVSTFNHIQYDYASVSYVGVLPVLNLEIFNDVEGDGTIEEPYYILY